MDSKQAVIFDRLFAKVNALNTLFVLLVIEQEMP